MQRLFIDRARLVPGTLMLTGEEHHYLRRVLRVIAGDELTLFDGQGGEAPARVLRMGPRALELTVGERTQQAARVGPELVLVQSLLKSDKMDWVVQKATELGATGVIPVESVRSVERLEGDRAVSRRERWLKIAVEAARQSGRATVPHIAPVTGLPDVLPALGAETLKLCFWEEAKPPEQSLRGLIPAERPVRVAVLVGPEGGLAPSEVHAATQHGWLTASLGPRVLRAETAAIAALAIVGYALGDLGG